MKQTHIMLDLETLGTRPGSVIASIGAVVFDLNGVSPRRIFYRRIDITKALAEGFTIGGDTLKWWLQQSPEAQKELYAEGVSTYEALEAFNDFIGSDNACVWGNGASFDNALLSEAYAVCGLPQPWKFWNDRCYRTVKSLHPDMPMTKREGTHHNALDDAISQAEHLITLSSFQAMMLAEGGEASRFVGQSPLLGRGYGDDISADAKAGKDALEEVEERKISHLP